MSEKGVAPKQREVVTKVAATYRRMKHLPPVVSQNLDETPDSRSLKWSPTSCHFVADVENALRAALAGRPNRQELIKAWVRLCVDSDSVIGPYEAELIALMYPLIRARGLGWTYFKPYRFGRRAA